MNESINQYSIWLTGDYDRIHARTRDSFVGYHPSWSHSAKMNVIGTRYYISLVGLSFSLILIGLNDSQTFSTYLSSFKKSSFLYSEIRKNKIWNRSKHFINHADNFETKDVDLSIRLRLGVKKLHKEVALETNSNNIEHWVEKGVATVRERNKHNVLVF